MSSEYSVVVGLPFPCVAPDREHDDKVDSTLDERLCIGSDVWRSMDEVSGAELEEDIVFCSEGVAWELGGVRLELVDAWDGIQGREESNWGHTS
jgi:hypothetical protein